MFSLPNGNTTLGALRTMLTKALGPRQDLSEHYSCGLLEIGVVSAFLLESQLTQAPAIGAASIPHEAEVHEHVEFLRRGRASVMSPCLSMVLDLPRSDSDGIRVVTYSTMERGVLTSSVECPWTVDRGHITGAVSVYSTNADKLRVLWQLITIRPLSVGRFSLAFAGERAFMKAKEQFLSSVR